MNRLLVVLIVVSVIGSGCLVASGKKDTVEKLLEYRDSYVGDASAVGSIFSLLEIRHRGYELITDKEPYGIIVNLEENISNDRLAYDTAFIFALIDNVSFITFESDPHRVTVDRKQINETYGRDLRELTGNREKLLGTIGH